MASTLDEEDLSIAISSSSSNVARRGSALPQDKEHEAQERLREQQQRMMQRADALSRTSAGQRLGQYKIVKTLGEGSFGKVKLAIHEVTNQKVALKIINRRKLVTRDMAGRIEREIQYLQLLRHPHIIKL
jgi:carbon catabolite-derepressing protein kinase